MEPDTQPTLTVSPTGTPVLPSWVPKLAERFGLPASPDSPPPTRPL